MKDTEAKASMDPEAKHPLPEALVSREIKLRSGSSERSGGSRR